MKRNSVFDDCSVAKLKEFELGADFKEVLHLEAGRRAADVRGAVPEEEGGEVARGGGGRGGVGFEGGDEAGVAPVEAGDGGDDGVDVGVGGFFAGGG